MDHGRLESVPQFIVNPEDTAYTNLTSTCTNTQALNLCPLYTTADTAMQGLAAAVRGDSEAVLEFKAAHNSEEPESATEDDAAAHAVSTPRPVASGV
jgi:hypothetical protein